MSQWAAVWLRRIWGTIGAVSVRTKIMGIVLTLVILLGAGVTVQVRATMAHVLGRELEQRGISVTRDLAARSTDFVLTNNVYALYELLRDTADNNEDLRYAFVLDAEGQVLAHTFKQGVPHGLLTINPVRSDERSRLQVLNTEEGLIHDVAVPIFQGRAGTARAGFSEQRLQTLLAVTTRQLLLMTLLVSLIGVLGGYLLAWILTRPVQTLVEVTRAVAQGDLSRRAPRWANDEIGDLGSAFNAMVEALSQARAESLRLWEELKRRDAMRGQLLEQAMTAQEEERKRIARELHDQTGQSLTSLLVGLRTLESDPNPAHLQDLKAIVADTLEGVRNLALELRPSVLDDLGLVPALERYVRTYSSRYNLPVDFQTVGLNGRLRCPPAAETALYRIVQEALTNVARHAQAQQVSVLLEKRGAALVVIVEDDGVGFDAGQLMTGPVNEHWLGLHGMRERAELVGGTLTIESTPDVGTTVFIEVPIAEWASRDEK